MGWTIVIGEKLEQELTLISFLSVWMEFSAAPHRTKDDNEWWASNESDNLNESFGSRIKKEVLYFSWTESFVTEFRFRSTGHWRNFSAFERGCMVRRTLTSRDRRKMHSILIYLHSHAWRIRKDKDNETLKQLDLISAS